MNSENIFFLKKKNEFISLFDLNLYVFVIVFFY